jgi:hypothetical protein
VPGVTEPSYLELALTSTREAFQAACLFSFLLGRAAARPGLDSFDEATSSDGRALPTPASGFLVLAVRKVQGTFESMITVGRTANNDIVVPCGTVSRFHAFFSVAQDLPDPAATAAGGLLLTDAGSSHGTFVDGKRLPAKQATRVQRGQRIGFATQELRLLDAGDCWDELLRDPR